MYSVLVFMGFCASFFPLHDRVLNDISFNIVQVTRVFESEFCSPEIHVLVCNLHNLTNLSLFLFYLE